MTELGQRPETKRERKHFRLHLPAVVVFCAGVLTSLLLYIYVRSWDRDHAMLEFSMRAQSEAAFFRRSMEHTIQAFRGLRPFRPGQKDPPAVAAGNFMDHRDFDVFIKRPLSPLAGIKAVAWIPCVKGADRTEYVGLARSGDYPDFQFTDLASNGELVRSERRNEYFPVHHLDFYNGTSATPGLDLATDPLHIDSLRAARITGQTIITVSDPSAANDGGGVHMEVLQPIYALDADSQLGERHREPLGIVLGMFSVSQMVNDTMANLDDPMVGFQIYAGAVQPNHLIYEDQSLWAPPPVPTRGEAGRDASPLTWTTSFDAAGQQWSMLFYPTSGAFSARGLWAPWQILAMGLFVSLLLGAHLHDLGNRKAHVDRLVIERTGELSEANIDLEKEIAERRKAEAELRKISRAVEQSANLVIITDTDGLIEYVNPKFIEITGYTSEEAVGRDPGFLGTDRNERKQMKRLAEAVSLGRDWQGEFLNETKDGRLFRTNATISPIRNDDGVITHFVSVQVDITEQKKLEEQFLQAQKMEIVGRMVGGVAHDFNNILTTILGFGQIFLRKTERNHWMHSGLQEIVNAAERASHLTKQLLTFARKKDQHAPKVHLEINSAIRSMEKLVRRTLGEDIELSVLLDDDIGGVWGVQSQLEQVIMNLAVNARDAMPAGGKMAIRSRHVVLEEDFCSSRLNLSPGDFILLSVSDTGCGMDQEVIDHIFEPFFTTKELGKGTGLGLSTVYGIVKDHGGDIEIYSEVGVGSEFKIYFPQSAEEGEKVERKEEAEPPRGHETILVVEDDESVRQVTVMVLKELGYQVLEAAHGREALEICQNGNGRFDLLLVDVVMPQMSGPALVDHLRELNLDYKLIYTSGFAEHPSLKESMDLRGAHFIEKPFTRERLGRTVREVLDVA